jgi:calcineurin-like phosphoesterase family protein
MARYLISDHHFGHSNIIKYCDRPFTSVGEMDNAMLDHYYETVGPDDVLIHLGDVAMDMQDGRETIERFDQLDGDLLVRGNHDIGLNGEDAPFPVIDSCTIEHGGYEFYCTHRPEDVPQSWDSWVLHGHHHNNDLEVFPFVFYDEQRVNVGAEVLDYRPIQLDTIVEILEKSTSKIHLPYRADADGMVTDTTNDQP